ncbi:MAG TPA: alpha/beta hydrolase [Vicinamibacterales bacterium]|nr:alpha/beta hydrolase [Vicinamibacterales bacterium]
MSLFHRDNGSGEVLLLLHGFTGSGDDWRHVFPEPMPGHRVITPDLPAHGRSPNPRPDFKFADVARDVFAMLDELGIGRVKAIGMSAGANTLLHMATQQPDRVAAMVHVSGTPRFPDQARAIMRGMTADGLANPDLARYAHAFAEDREDMNFDSASLGRITARTLIVHGDRDPLYPVELAVELLRGIPHSALWVVPNGGHGPIFGEQAAPFVTTATAFLTT